MGTLLRSFAALLLLAAPLRSQEPSFLIVMVDDVGVDRIAAYGLGADPGRTPNIDGLAADGVLFRHAYANPVCSPTRATLLTGRHSFRTEIGNIIRKSDSPTALALSEVTLPEILGTRYTSAVLGKWHLSTPHFSPLHPVHSGFDVASGSIFNLGPGSYYEWQKTVNGHQRRSRTYATTDTIDDAIRAVRNLPEPWLIYVALHAAHRPLHKPPPWLHSYNLTSPPAADPVTHVKAAVEAMDTEFGRLLAEVDRGATTVFFLGDNGTAEHAVEPPFIPSQAKGTVYDGGVRVPFIVAGTAVRQQGVECTALINTTDVFATIAELAGRPSLAEDSVSLVPYLDDAATPSLREWVYSEFFTPNGPGPYDAYLQMVRGPRYKLVRIRHEQRLELYDMQQDPFEQSDLLLQPVLSAGERAAFDRLRHQLDSMR